MKSIHMACDHAGIELKETLRAHLEKMGYTVTDHGTHSKESCDYPVFAHALCHAVEAEGVPGILICGTGIGMSIAANRHKGIRAALCTTELHARFTRLHNNANVLCLGARVTGVELALAIVDTFLSAISAASTSSMPSPGACHAALQYPYPQKGRIRPRPARKSQHVCLRHHRL